MTSRRRWLVIAQPKRRAPFAFLGVVQGARRRSDALELARREFPGYSSYHVSRRRAPYNASDRVPVRA